MDAIQITLAIAAATFAAAVTFAKANAGSVAGPLDDFSASPAVLTGTPSPQDHRPFNHGRIIAGPGFSLEIRD